MKITRTQRAIIKDRVVVVAQDRRPARLDEPLDGLDANAAAVVKELLRKLADQGRKVVAEAFGGDKANRVPTGVVDILKPEGIEFTSAEQLIVRGVGQVQDLEQIRQIVITSREPLGITAETAWRVLPLGGEPPLHRSVLRLIGEEARKRFADLLKEAQQKGLIKLDPDEKSGGYVIRKISVGVGVERTFPVHSPMISTIEVLTRGAVRRSKLYYLRGRIGKKATKIKEKRQA